METITVYQGSVAQQACQAILAANSNNAMYHTKYDQPVEGINIKSAGFWEEDGKWIAYDNSTFDCWVEEFDNKKDARVYANEALSNGVINQVEV